MLDTIKKLRAILSPREVRSFVFLLFVIFFMGAFELAGIASIMPFMQLVSQPDAIEHNRLLSTIYAQLDFADERSFLFALGVAVLVLLTLANVMTVFTLWLQHKFAWDSAHTIANRLLGKYLHQSYDFFLNQNTSILGKQILSESNDLANGVLLAVAVLIAKAFVAVAIFALLVLVDPWLAVILFSAFGCVYALMYSATRKYLLRLGNDRFEANELRFKAVNEALAGMKILKISGKEDYFYDRFSIASRQLCRVEPLREAAFITPVYFVQTLAFGTILVLILYLLATEQGLQEVIPLLALYALAGYRLLPSLQQIYRSIARIRYQRPMVDAVYNDLIVDNNSNYIKDSNARLRFYSEIEIRDVCYRYPASTADVLHHISLIIQKQQRIAFVGPTGSGKTTLVDLIVGLLEPTGGTIAIDRQVLAKSNARQWQRQIGYVPQDVVLYDDTVAKNIAYGVPAAEIDMARVKQVVKIAKLDAFIATELPDGYEALLGERGIRLSGGQRQRIGLARALYHNPSVVVLDEATSALDGITESAVMEEMLNALAGVTTVMIAHRLDTVKDCDFIYVMEEGRIVSQGTYRQLISENGVFRRMAKVRTPFDLHKAT